MVVLGFFLIMVVLFFLALFFITLNLIFIIIWKVRKRIGKTPKKRYIVIPIIFLIISILAELIPVGWVMMVRSGNKSISNKVVIAQSGKVGYWGHANSDDTIEYFEMDGTTYVHVLDIDSYRTLKLGEPVANIRYKSDESRFNKILVLIFGRDETSTLYPVINEKGLEIYTIGGSLIYCPKNQSNLVLAYFNDRSH